MKNEEQTTRRTRRSFIKKSAAAGIGAKAALVFGGLVTTSHASGSSILYCDPSTSGLNPETFQWVVAGDVYCWERFECFNNHGGSMGLHTKGLVKCDPSGPAGDWVECTSLEVKDPEDLPFCSVS